WTDIAVSGPLLAAAISQYLLHEHPLLGLFDADLFIRDLTTPATTFCSRLLFHSLIAFACHGYTFVDPSAASLAITFYAEAISLWHSEPAQDSITTLSASIILFAASSNMGRGMDGLQILKDSALIGSRLGLFENSSEEQLSIHRDKRQVYSSDMDRARCTAAWGTFNWHTFHAFYDRQGPLINSPPSVQIPHFQVNVPYISETFPTLCRLCIILNDMAWQYYSQRTPPTETVPREAAEILYQRLLSWSDDLPGSLIRGPGTSHHVVVAHIWYHTIIIDTFRPFSSEPQSKPVVVTAASIKQLKRLIYIYRSTFVSSNAMILYQPGLLYLVNYLLKDVDNNESHFYFLLCMGAYLKLASCFPIVGCIAKSIVNMALERGVVLPADAAAALEEIE
ncbi:uncharacterized protein BDR25DRAFT_203752, partial [Lindgomyces ingoldianus]